MISPASSVKPLLFAAGAVVLWGTSYAVTKSAYAFIPPMFVVWCRMLIAMAAFSLVLPVAKRVVAPAKLAEYRPGDWKLLGVTVLCIPCLYYTFEGYAISFTTSSQAGLVAAVMPLIVSVTAWVVLRERPTARLVVAAIISLAGVAALSLGGESGVDAPNPALGNLLELGAMLSAAGSTLAVKRLSTHYHPLLLTGAQMAAGSLFFAPMAMLTGRLEWASVPAVAWASVAYLGIGCGLGAFAMYNSALRLMPAGRTALAVNAVPVVALVTGWLALGERLTLVQGLACVVILGSVVLAQINSVKRSTGLPASV